MTRILFLLPFPFLPFFLYSFNHLPCHSEFRSTSRRVVIENKKKYFQWSNLITFSFGSLLLFWSCCYLPFGLDGFSILFFSSTEAITFPIAHCLLIFILVVETFIFYIFLLLLFYQAASVSCLLPILHRPCKKLCLFILVHHFLNRSYLIEHWAKRIPWHWFTLSSYPRTFLFLNIFSLIYYFCLHP